MAPSALPVRSAETNAPTIETKKYPAPKKYSGSLDQFQFEETTPVIGREYLSVNLVDDILNAPNSDELLQDLAVTSEHYT